MINLNTSTMIYQPVKQVFDFVSTPENDFQWQYGTLAAARLSADANAGALGTFFRSIGHLMGHRVQSTFEVTEYEPNRKYSFKSLSGPVHSSTSYTLEDVSGRTGFNISIQASAPRFFEITEKLLWNTMKIQLEENVTSLKTILEETSTTSRPQRDGRAVTETLQR